MTQRKMKNLATQTLREKLETIFFDENESHFNIIYDRWGMLKYFFQQNQNKLPNIRILTIQSDVHPIEFLDRLIITNDFDQKDGWYQHQWIIHIFGDHGSEIETFGSFFYYEMAGKVWKIDNFSGLLMRPELEWMDSIQMESLLEIHSQLNEFILNYLIDIPIETFINDDNTLNEWAVWLCFITSKQVQNRNNLIEMPVWNKIIHDKSAITPDRILLQLIYWINPLNFLQLDENTSNLLNNFMKIFARELKFPDLTFSDNWQDNITKIIQFIFQQIKVKGQKKKAVRKKTNILEDLIEQSKDRILPQPTIEILTNFVYEWLSNSDKILIERYQQWTHLFRKTQPEIQIKDDELESTTQIFTYTGLIDISLIIKLLKIQINTPCQIDEWYEKIQKIIKQREGLWKEYASLWWKDKDLFLNNEKSFSIDQLWLLTEQLGVIIALSTFTIEKWEPQNHNKIREYAWILEKAFLEIMNSKFTCILNGAEYFSPIVQIHTKTNQLYIQLRDQFNEKFVQFYLQQLTESKSSLFFKNRDIIWKEIIPKIKADHTIGLIFCDGLRYDLNLELSQFLEKWMQIQDPLINSQEREMITTLAWLPSITNLGWNRLLTKKNELYMKIVGDNVVSGVIDGDQKSILNNPKDRIQRLNKIIKDAGLKVNINELSLNSLSEQKRIIRQKIQNQNSEIPIIFYDKIDNHDLTLEEFLEKKELILSELKDLIWQLHNIGIEYVYILMDHGFLFLNNREPLKEVPTGVLHKRFCVSPNTFTEEAMKKYPDWVILSLEKMGFTLEDEKNSIKTLILPKNYNIFKKPRSETTYYVHGGLSYQECDLAFLRSYCILKPEVVIESIDVIENDHVTTSSGENVYILKEIGEVKYLQIQLTTRKKDEKMESLRPLTLKVFCENSQVRVEPDQEMSLSSGLKRNFKLILPKSLIYPKIDIQIRNGENEIIDQKSFTVNEPSIYGSQELF